MSSSILSACATFLPFAITVRFLMATVPIAFSLKRCGHHSAGSLTAFSHFRVKIFAAVAGRS
jgi:hypothetical protein